MQALKLLGNSWVSTPDSANLSIADNLDLRIRLAMDNWYPTSRQTFIAKSTGNEEWSFHTEETGQGILQFVFTGGGTNIENSSVGVDFENGSLHWIRVRRDGTSVFFYTSDDDTDVHTAVSWTQLGTTQTTVATGININLSTHVTVGASRTGGDDPVLGYVRTAVVVHDAITRADPVFTGSEWTVGDIAGDTGTDGANTWTLGGTAQIVGDNVEGVHLSVDVSFGFAPFYGQPIWTDITDDVRAISTNRGRNYELDRFDAGTATFEIDNTSGWYHAHNTASPYYPNIKPMVPIRVRAVHDGTIYPIWRGYVDRWPVSYPGNIESIVTVQATDLFKALSLADASQEDRNALVTALSPVAWWRFNDDTDSSVAGTHDLTITGASTGNPGVWTEDMAGTFDGVTDFATVANETDIELRSDMTIEMWFRPELSVVQTGETFSSDDTWVCPAGVTAVTVESWGGGGGGGGGDSLGGGFGMSGGGGGAGGYARAIVEVEPGTSYTIQVGVAGTAGTSGGDGANGGSSYFGDFQARGNGGTGGGGGIGYTGVGGAGGGGRDGTVIETGGRGGDGLADFDALGGIDAAGGGGGGGAGSLSGHGQAGRSMDQNLGGGLGGQGGGTGGDGGNGGFPTPTAGSAGSAPGGGGGGGGRSSTGDSNGGAGAIGRVRLSYSVTEAMTPLSVRGTDNLYQFDWDGYRLYFRPTTSTSGAALIGGCAPNEWHHVVVTIDWDTGRAIKAYVNGSLTFDGSVGYQPPVAVRAVNIGRRATDNDRYFKGDISEVVVYNSILTQQDVAGLYAAQLEGFATQPTGDRIEYVLGTAAVGVGVEVTKVDLDPGQTIISGPNSPTDVTSLEAIQIAADTEFGQFFIGKDGLPTFHDRYHRLIDQATPLATLDETDYETIHLLGRDELKVLNDVRVSPSDTAEPFIAQDASSISEYGRRTYEITIYPDDQNEGYDIALWILSRFKAPQDDIESIPFRLYEEVTDFPTLLAAEIGNRYNIEVPLEGDDLDIDVYLERISHNINFQQWTMDWTVSPAGESVTFWLLGVAGSSELGETTVLGF